MPLSQRFNNAKREIRDFLYGMLYHQIYLDSLKYAKGYRDFFLFMLYGELLGIPLLSNFYTLRSLPYLIGEIYGWKVRMLRERDLTDEAPDIA